MANSSHIGSSADDDSATAQAVTDAELLAERFRELHRLCLAEYPTYTDLYADYLTTSTRLLGMSTGIVSRIEGETYTILAVTSPNPRMRVGQSFALGDTYCAQVVDRCRTIAHADIGADSQCVQQYGQLPLYRDNDSQSYISSPIRVENRIYGTLSFTHPQPRKISFTSGDLEFVEMMAKGLGQVIERDLLEQRRRTSAQRMRETTELFESAFHYAPIGIALVAPDGKWLRVNSALCDIVGYPAEELLRLDFQTITHPDDLDADLKYVQQMLAKERSSYAMEKRYFHSDGNIVWVLLSVSLVFNEDGTPRYFISQIQDITDKKHAQQQLEHKQHQLEIANRKLEELATRDSLTQLYNRRAFDEKLHEERHRAQRSGEPLSLLMLDVDHFKNFNDELGHLKGDHALQAVARVLQLQARVSDTVARYGGEEFVMILPNTNKAGCWRIAERVRQEISDIARFGKSLTVSIGSVTADPNTINVAAMDNERLLAAADEALYNAKAGGRDQVRQSTRALND